MERLATGDGQLHLLAVDNLAYSELEHGDVGAARRELALLQELSRHYDGPLNTNALDTVARVHPLCGAPREAEGAALGAVRTSAQMDSKNADDLPGCLLTLAVAQRTLGDPDAASAGVIR